MSIGHVPRRAKVRFLPTLSCPIAVLGLSSWSAHAKTDDERLGLNGSRGYMTSHQAELDRHVMAASIDIGSGRMAGFFTGGPWAELPGRTFEFSPVDAKRSLKWSHEDSELCLSRLINLPNPNRLYFDIASDDFSRSI